MIGPEHLLDFAVRALDGDDRSEVNARRAVSAAYYALLHMLAQAGADLFAGSPEQRQRIARAYNHNALIKAARKIDNAARQSSAAPARDDGLLELARVLMDLHQARESADYDLLSTLDWVDAERLIWAAYDEWLRFDALKARSGTIDFLLDPLFPERARNG